ncbi:DUF1853 family protein [Caballeronia sp. LZ062]|uniref:DUF1853 family protein n=1 Tax=unclassified Caballeronia TaxID=2646786 RepID=UPI00285F89B4|nr:MULTISPECIES: DUF1853 family protein [unclassified Caballeronia]MDR5854308.1 DUF1853 family protein [Caballeronia sp. LZ050]MDR5871161.1 DUF1853 family protein [Caballeronia sp. LZ062]
MTGLSRLVDRFEDATVRDLAWLLFSPDLLRESAAGAPLAEPFESAGTRDATLAWLAALDAAPDALHVRSRNPKSTRLGIYAESLLEFFLAHGPAARLIAANVPLRRQRRTIGECDFLLESATGARLHWELAVKFYLHIGDGGARAARLSDYVGPNLQDRFDLKHARLLTHQLGLTSRAEFAALGLAGQWRPEMFIKGRLFYHDEGIAPAPEVGEAHVRGWWLTATEWRHRHGQAGRHENRVWVVQPRLAWLAPRRLSASDAESLITEAAAIHAYLAAITAPTMIAGYVRDEAGGWGEESRGFVVPDDWPGRARAFAAFGLPAPA